MVSNKNQTHDNNSKFEDDLSEDVLGKEIGKVLKGETTTNETNRQIELEVETDQNIVKETLIMPTEFEIAITQYMDVITQETQKYAEGSYGYECLTNQFGKAAAIVISVVNAGEESNKLLPHATTLNEALNNLNIPQNIQDDANLDSEKKGSESWNNFYMFGSKFLVIKSDDLNLWSHDTARADVKAIKEYKKNKLFEQSKAQLNSKYKKKGNGFK
ncbi:hypothetical protein [Chryseobacterium gambrini]|uniref:hypothetical protein n=1 Tax=Chryseobacterium gambrini TaxID=373672 RepID=UPI003D0CFB69